jgi:hypothetical protein
MTPKDLQAQYKVETGKYGKESSSTCPYCRKVLISTGTVTQDYVDWLENMVVELSARPNLDCNNCDPLSDAESKIGELRDQLKDAEAEIYDLKYQIDSK